MNKIECLKKFKEDYVTQSTVIRRYKENRFSNNPEVQSFNTKEVNRQVKKATIMNLLYFYVKWSGKRPASDCVSYTRKNTISRFVNTYGIEVDYNNIERVLDQKLSIMIHWRHRLSVDLNSPKILLPKKVLCYIAKNIASSQEETISIYNGFCNWILESEICNDYLGKKKRIINE